MFDFMRYFLQNLGSMPSLQALSMASINDHTLLPLTALHSLTHLAIAAHTLQLEPSPPIILPAGLTSLHFLCLEAGQETADRLVLEALLQLQHTCVESFYVMEGKLGNPHPLDIECSILDDLAPGNCAAAGVVFQRS